MDATLAEVICDRFPEILTFDKEGDFDQIRGVEVPQGEPQSEYFNGAATPNSHALFDSAWSVPEHVKSGTIEAVGFLRKVDQSPAAPCFVIRRIMDEKGEVICEWHGAPLDKDWGDGKRYRFPWARLNPPPSGLSRNCSTRTSRVRWELSREIIKASHARTDERFLQSSTKRRSCRPNTAWGSSVFELLYEPKVKDIRFRPVRTCRCGQEDLAARIPSVSALREKRILLCGVGALGSFFAVQLARNGIGRLDIADFDYFEPATARRWIAGLEHFGKEKPLAIRDIVRENYPWTEINMYDLKVGGCRFDPAGADQFDELAALIDAADCVIDTTAEVTSSHILADMSMWLGKPYVLANATPGAWGGMVYQWRPDHNY